TIIKEGNGTFKLYGVSSEGYGKGSYKLMVMCDFNVQFDGKSYTIRANTYDGLPNGLDLFSDEAMNLFNATTVSANSEITSNSLSNSRTVMPASVGVSSGTSNNRFASFFSNLFGGMKFVSPQVVTFNPASGTDTLTIGSAELSGNLEVTASDNLAHLYYKNLVNSSTVSTVKAHRINAASGLTIKKSFGSGGVGDYIVFQPGVYEIPVTSTAEETGGIDILNRTELESRAGASGSNYTLLSKVTTYTIMDKEYY
ncbi:MAG: hypothetical protein UIM53_10385, partial [Acutalibacteraceae bacterium]|nr:hypothetical protein [Acutalibacteraceae bacterium]